MRIDIKAALRSLGSPPVDLYDEAEKNPEQTWAALLESVDDSLTDDELSILAVDVVDTIRVYGQETLWRRVVAESVGHPQLSRVVRALERYYRKYDVLFRLLHGEAGAPRVLAGGDLPLPNRSQEAPVSRSGAKHEQLTASERSAFLANDYATWERVQRMIEDDPQSAWDLGLTMLEEVDDSSLSTVGIALFEALITHRERELWDAVVAHVRTNERFRKALSNTYLNPTEPFMDALIEALAGPR